VASKRGQGDGCRLVAGDAEPSMTEFKSFRRTNLRRRRYDDTVGELGKGVTVDADEP
jgi:hypothetical protein